MESNHRHPVHRTGALTPELLALARKVEVSSPRELPRVRAFKARCATGRTPSMAEGGGHGPQSPETPSRFRGGAGTPVRFTFHAPKRKVRDLNPGGPQRPVHAFRACPSCHPDTFHVRRADDSNVTAVTAHSLAARPSTLAGSPSTGTMLRSAPRTRTGITRGLNALALPIGLERFGVDDGVRTRGLHLGKVTRCRLRHIHIERTTGFEPALSAWEADVLPLTLRSRRAPDPNRTGGLARTEGALLPTELQGHGLGTRDSNPDSEDQNLAACR